MIHLSNKKTPNPIHSLKKMLILFYDLTVGDPPIGYPLIAILESLDPY